MHHLIEATRAYLMGETNAPSKDELLQAANHYLEAHVASNVWFTEDLRNHVYRRKVDPDFDYGAPTPEMSPELEQLATALTTKVGWALGEFPIEKGWEVIEELSYGTPGWNDIPDAGDK